MKLLRTIIAYGLSALLVVFLLSCTPEIHVSYLAKLRIGMGPDQPPRVMGVNPTKTIQWSTVEGGDKIVVQVYQMGSIGVPSSTYFLAYRNGELIFWGYPHEFARSSEIIIREIGKGALNRQ